MSICLRPGCHNKITSGRLVCLTHWMRLPHEVKAKVSEHISSRNFDSARMVIRDFYTSLESQWQR